MQSDLVIADGNLGIAVYDPDVRGDQVRVRTFYDNDEGVYDKECVYHVDLPVAPQEIA